MDILDTIRSYVRLFIRKLLKTVLLFTGKQVNPNVITIVGSLLYIPVAWLIIRDHFVLAGLSLIVVGLLDTVDGEVARLLHKSSNLGILLDASTDRIKESLLYIALTYYFIERFDSTGILLSIATATGALCVSYIKSKGETILARHTETNLSPNEINRIFQDGLARVEVRTTLFILGLLFGIPSFMLVINALISWITAFYRLYAIGKRLS